MAVACRRQGRAGLRCRVQEAHARCSSRGTGGKGRGTVQKRGGRVGGKGARLGCEAGDLGSGQRRVQARRG
ncbi:hypothetical protein SLEP1_g34847 [Rubroshorea leprosula]|uniref:Uncharacterized protein n=1 Tax=Rubroshorea leprosula TaxID=152421 RepID=A0AAV5KLK3_9ROSI|nr:hypothetical protein SLEP1_g34847 [Rubroshorea leprosula]